MFSSRSERGLDRLVELWPVILNLKPDATLKIASYNEFPNNENDTTLLATILKYPSIQHVGKLSPKELYAYMGTSEYWMFPSYWLETSCITSLEMLMSGVKCFYYPLGGIGDTLQTFGVPVNPGYELEKISIPVDIQAGKEYAMSCSWKNRAEQWVDLFK